MKVEIVKQLELGGGAPVLIVPVVRDSLEKDPLAARLNRRMGGHLAEAANQENFSGKAGQVITFNVHGARLPGRICLVGLGEQDSLDCEKFRRAAGRAADVLRSWSAAKALLACRIPPRGAGIAAGDVCGALVEGMTLGLYRFEKYKSADAENPSYPGLEELELFFCDGRGTALRQQSEALSAVVGRARVVAGGVIAARELVNEIPTELTPERLAEKAAALAESHEGLSCRVLDEQEMEREKMGASLAVARGSANPPRFIELSWEPSGPVSSAERLVLVGKGVCFDSGGLNIKTGPNMSTMKMDMSGAAAVIGAIGVIAELKLPVRVTAVVAAVENMPGGRSYKPDDIVRALDGTTIEVGNTDAEGRLTLADALGWAVGRLEATRIVELATLTGACVAALGPTTAGLFGNDEAWSSRVMAAAGLSGEKFCRLPLDGDMREDIRSDFADVKNVGATRWGGAITAALFLQKFAGDTPWVHLDIAGPAWAEKKRHYQGPGGTGYGVRLLVRLAEDLAADR
ncbi:MAG: leucyl aminopeptidase [Candidatus Glassbacteria bacterium]|nr:leucyl aminopeptidase [Candidatus Glassbacteria bacterium]